MIDAAERERRWKDIQARLREGHKGNTEVEQYYTADVQWLVDRLALCANEALERVRKVSAKWDGLADAIDDGSGATDCAITAARLRAMAKQVDEACALKAEG